MAPRLMVTKKVTSAIAALAATALSATLLAAPAQAADTGLFGSQNPQFDGVFRQSLAIAGLDAVGADVPDAAIDWLVDQQCANGSFESYRANTSGACATSDPENFSGPNVDATGLAAVALYLADREAEARRAAAWLLRAQNSDSGFPSYLGGQSNANSTAMALIGLQTVQAGTYASAVRGAKSFLGTLKLKCSSGGGLSFLKGGTPNGLASSQALMGLAGALPVEDNVDLRNDPDCRKRDTNSNVGSFVASAISEDGAIPSDFGSGPDLSSTGWALLGLTALGRGSSAVQSGLATLQDEATEYAISDGEAVPAALGLLLLVSEATDTSARNFGGVNLVTALRSSIR